MDVGTYIGTGIDPLNVATVGFLPANVFLNSGHMKPAHHWRDASTAACPSAASTTAP